MATEVEPVSDRVERPRRLLPFATQAPFYGWWVLVAMSMLRVVASGFGNNVRSLLVLPLENDFGASRTEVSLMATGGSVAVAVTGPLGGWLMDRYGMRSVMLVTLLITVAGYFLLAATNALWQVIFIFTVPLGVAYNWAVLNSGAPVLNNWFNRQKARALQEKRRLDADVVQPALAQQRAAEENARGDAAALIERGRAEAESLRKLVEAYRAGGAGARDVLALQSLLPLLSRVAGSDHALSIKKLSVLPPDGGAGSDLARKAIGATEQIRAATGVDLGGVAKKFGG